MLNPPSAPPGLVCNQATDGSITTFTNVVFSWQPPTSSAGLNGYSYGFDQTPGNITNTVGSSIAINNITLGIHKFYVQAQDTNGIWGPTSGFTLITSRAPDAPPGLVCDHVTNGVLTYYTNLLFSWSVPDSPNGVFGYSYALDQTPQHVFVSSETNATITGVSSGAHVFQVQALGWGFNGLFGPSATFVLLVVWPPSAPTSLVCNHATNEMPTTFSNVVFSWQPPASSAGLNGYSYGFDQMPASVTNIFSTSVSINNVTLGSHMFYVMAQDTNDVWGPPASFTLIVSQPPGAPAGLVCNLATNGVVTYYSNLVFSWSVPNSPDGIAGYDYGLDEAPSLWTTATSAAISGVSAGTHLFEVQAQGGYGLWGPTTAFTLVVINPPGAPPGLVCNHATNALPTTFNNFAFSWQRPVTSAGLNGYSYGFDQAPGNVINTVVASATINNVTLGSHLFQVQAQDTNGVWGPATNFQFTVWAPGTEPPGAPPGLVCNAASNGVPTQTTNNIVFTWQVPASESGVTGYSYALNGTPGNVVATTATSVTFAIVAPGTYNFQVMAKGKNGVWGATSSFQLIVQSLPSPTDTSGPLPPWSIVALTFGVFAAGAWYIRRQQSGRLER